MSRKMSRTGLVLVVVALAALGAWAVYGYAQGQGPSAGGTSLAADQATPVSEPTGCRGGCEACPEDGNGVCDSVCDGVCDGMAACGRQGEAQCGKHGGKGGCGGGHGGNGGGCPHAD